MRFGNVIWDWNGTLLDDLCIGCDVLNVMLGRRGIGPVSVEYYKSVFCFPVENFYRTVGFDLEKESFHDMSEEFVKTYSECADGKLSLNEGAAETLACLKRSGRGCYILSALKEDFLIKALDNFGISDYFDAVYGACDIYASGKIATGQRLVKECGIKPESVLMVGDTVHDAEVAAALGFRSLLYAGGHNSASRLEREAEVIYSLKSVLDYV